MMPEQTLLGRYRLERVLGEGGMGVVWEATHLRLQTKVALKLMRESRHQKPEWATRLINEARTVATLDSAHVVKMLDVDETDEGFPFLVMELLKGSDASTYIKEHGALSAELASAWILEACEGLAEAHGRGIVHRDLKPANLFLARKAGQVTVKLLDFGVCRIVPSAPLSLSRGGVTQVGATLGSPFYMAPEQLLDAHTVDARADVWALGVILYELVTGKVPFDGDSLATVSAKIAAATPLKPSALREAAAPLDAIIAKCLEKTPSDRYADVHSLSAALEAVAKEEGAVRASDVERALLRGSQPSSSGINVATSQESNFTLAPESESETRFASNPRQATTASSKKGAKPGTETKKRSYASLGIVTFLIAAAIALAVVVKSRATSKPTADTASSRPAETQIPIPSAAVPASPTVTASSPSSGSRKPSSVMRAKERDPLDLEIK